MIKKSDINITAPPWLQIAVTEEHLHNFMSANRAYSIFADGFALRQKDPAPWDHTEAPLDFENEEEAPIWATDCWQMDQMKMVHVE